MLEAKIGDQQSKPQPESLPKSALKASTQRQVTGGKIIQMSREESEKVVVESIKKRPVQFTEDDSPKKAAPPKLEVIEEKVEPVLQPIKSKLDPSPLLPFLPPPIINPRTDKPLKSFIKKRQQPVAPQRDSSDDGDEAPRNDHDDYGNYEEEVVPIAAKPFLFGAVDK